MPYINVSETAISAEKSLKTKVNELHKDLLLGAKQLITVFGENRKGLGYHDAKILELLESLVEESGDTSKVLVLKRVLTLSAKTREEHRNNPPYTRRR